MEASLRSDGPSAQPDGSIVIWEPQPRQEAFITCPADDVGFGGARGGGKSDGVVGDFIDHEDTYAQHAIGMAFRRERTQLIELIERAKQILVPLGYKWHEQDKYFRGPKGGRLRFTYLESDSDADAYQGHSYTRLYPEEMGTFPSEAPINKLQATLRSGNGVPCQMKGTCNPGGPGHQWVKARYRLDTHPRGFEIFEFEFTNPFTKKKITKTRTFIPSKVTDNRFLGDDYVANLFQVGSENLVRAWLEGDWSVIEGAFFDCWSNEKHVLAPFAIPPDWLRFRSIDWGSAAPFSVGWWAVVGDDWSVREDAVRGHGTASSPHGGDDHQAQGSGISNASRGNAASSHDEYQRRGLRSVHPQGPNGVLPRGALVRYREWYGASSPNVGLKLTAEEVAQGILDKSLTDQIDPNKSPYAYTVADPSMWKQDGGPSLAERFVKAGLTGMKPADNTRVARLGAIGGWDLMRHRLKGLDGVPMLYVFSTCKDFIRTVPALQHDPDRPEDVQTDAEDHCGDESRYACSSRPWIPKPKVEPKPTELIYTAQSDGRIVANMSVMDWVRQQERKKARE